VAFKILPTAGASGDVTNRQILNGGDAGTTHILALRPVSTEFCDPIFGYSFSSNPYPDLGSQPTGPTSEVTPPGGMKSGDVALIFAYYRGNVTLSISETGGQTWTALSQVTQGTTNTSGIFYTVFNGTWTANPSVTVGSGTSGLTVAMYVFRGVDPDNVLDVPQSASGYTAPATPFDVTSTGITTNTDGAMVLAFWSSQDDNSWTVQTSGWMNLGGGQIRNQAGTDNSISVAFKIVPTAGASGDVTNRQILNGGDAGTTHILALKPIPPPTTTLGDGEDPSNSTVAPGSTNNYLDQFTFVTNKGTDSVTGLTVTTSNTGAIASMEIWNEAMTSQYFGTVYSPLGDDWNFSGGMPIPVSTTTASFRVIFTAKDHSSLAEGVYPVTGTVTGFTCTNSKLGTDNDSVTITVDNSPPENATWGTIIPGDAQIELNWTNPETDFYKVLILRKTGSEVADTPTEGTEYNVNDTIGESTVRYVGNGTNFTDTGLTNGTSYYYKIFAYDSYINYAVGVSTGPHIPPILTVLGDGTDPEDSTVAPGTTNLYLDQFTFHTSDSTDTVTALTVTTSSTTAIASMQIWNGAMTTQYFGTVSTPVGDNWNFSGGTPIPVSTTTASFRVIFTAKDHSSLAEGVYAVTGTVTSYTCSNSKSGTDTDSATITVDNSPPDNATWGTIIPGDTQIELNWTNPGTDFYKVLILRKVSSAVADTPTEGTEYNVNDTIGESTVRYVGNGTNFTDTGLTNGTSYYYKIFAYDAYINYASGVSTGPHIPTIETTTVLDDGTDPEDSTVAPGTTNLYLDQFTFHTSDSNDTVTALTVTSGNTGAIASMEIWNETMTTQYFGTVSTPEGNDWNFSSGTPIPVSTTTASFRVIFTAKDHSSLAEGVYAVTGTVTGFTCTNSKLGTDTDSAIITVDNSPPDNATWGTIIPGNSQIELNWANPGTDFYKVLILRKVSSAVTDTPAEGTEYNVNDTIGESTVRYVGNGTNFTDTGLTNGTSYYYKIFAYDSYINYAVGVSTGPHIPTILTILEDGTDPEDSTVAPGTTNLYLDQFIFHTSDSNDTVTALTVTTSSTTAIASMQIWNGAMTTQYFGTVSAPVGDNWNFSGGMPIPVSTTTASFRVIFTAKDHSSLSEGVYAVTGTVTSYTCTNSKSGTDTDSATITVDNSPPDNATWETIVPGNSQIELNWTNPGTDFYKVLILRKVSSAVTDTPTEGTEYNVNDTIGESTVRYVGNGTNFTDTGLTNGTSYYYKIFAYDSYINYAVGVSTGPYTPLPGNEVTIWGSLFDATDEYSPSPNVVFISDQVGYAFFVDTYLDNVAYSKTTNGGATWGSPVPLSGVMGTDKNWANVAVWYDQWTPGGTGTKIHIVAAEASTGDIWYNWLDTTDDTMRYAAVSVILGATYTPATSGGPSITKSTDGNLFILGFTDDFGKVYKSTDGGDNWTDTAITTGEIDDADEGQLLPLSGGDILLILQDLSADTVQSKVYDEGTDSWDASWTSIDTWVENATYDCTWGASLYKATGDIYLAGNTLPDGGVNYPLKAYKFTDSTRTWSTLTNIAAVAEALQATIAVDENNGDLYAVYIRGGTAGATTDVYYKKSTDGGSNWGEEIKISTTQDNLKYVRTNLTSNERIYAVWYNDDLNDILGNTVADLIPATIILGDGIDPSNSTVAPGGTNNYLDQFTFATDYGTGFVTALTVTTSSTTAITSMQIWNGAMTTQYFGTVSTPEGDNWNFSGGTLIPVSTTTASFRVIFTAKDHSSLSEGVYAVTGMVTSYTCTNPKSGTDTDSATITVDNSPPENATWGTIVSGNTQIELNWTNPGTDFYKELILRKAGSAVTEAPTEGTEYDAGNSIGVSTVCYVGSGTNFTDTGLTNGTSYYYKIFAYDAYINYASGVSTGPHIPEDTTPPAAITNLTGLCDSDTGEVTLYWSTPGDDGWNNTLPEGSKYIIDYSSYSVQWSTTNYKVEISTSGVAPHTQVSYTITGLTGDTTWYFQIWTRDEVPTNWSGLSNGATIWVNSVLGVSISTDTINLGVVEPGSYALTVSSVVITNNGNIKQKFKLKIVSEPNASWTSVTADPPGAEQYRYSGIFRSTQPATSDFLPEDSFSVSTERTSSSADLARDADPDEQKGFNVSPDNTRNLWFKFEAPTSTDITTTQAIPLRIIALPDD
jgi:hypothetical protein